MSGITFNINLSVSLTTTKFCFNNHKILHSRTNILNMVVTLLNRIFLENFDEVGIKTISGSIIRICLKSNILFMKMFLTFRPQLFLSPDELFYKLLEKNKISFKLNRKDYLFFHNTNTLPERRRIHNFLWEVGGSIEIINELSL